MPKWWKSAQSGHLEWFITLNQSLNEHKIELSNFTLYESGDGGIFLSNHETSQVWRFQVFEQRRWAFDVTVDDDVDAVEVLLNDRLVGEAEPLQT